jgi:PucR C-terminal helix-turn-helix domain
MDESEHTVAHAVALLELDPRTMERLSAAVTAIADQAVGSIIDGVPGYAGALSGRMGHVIRGAVQLALGNFLKVARSADGSDPSVPIAQSTAAAYDLGRGEARSGRSMDALLAAYRIGARVCWRGLSDVAVAADVPAATLGRFAELVFAYIDELSAASVAGHRDELATTGRTRDRYLQQLTGHLVGGSDGAVLSAAASRAGWAPPRTLTAVLLPDGQVSAVLRHLDARTLQISGDLPGVEGDAGVSALLVPDIRGVDRVRLAQMLRGRDAIIGPERPWAQAGISYYRAVQARGLPPRPGRAAVDTDERLVELVVRADAEAYGDLRKAALAPLADLKPDVRRRLEETLRCWLLHHGRRQAVADDLFVHAQTVRYRMGQLRELFGDLLDDPESVLRLTLALAVPGGTRLD